MISGIRPLRQKRKMKLDKSSYIYGETEVIAIAIRGKRNLAQQDTATIALKVVLNEAMDEMSKSKCSIEDLLGDDKREWRKKIRDEIKPLLTASKNYQNTYCVESELLPKSESGEKVEDYA
jgi:hypothetical protein